MHAKGVPVPPRFRPNIEIKGGLGKPRRLSCAPGLKVMTASAQSRSASKRDRLIGLVTDHSLLRGHQIKLVSGAESSFYFNMKPTAFDPEGAALIAELVLDEVLRDGAELVGGLEMGAVPIVACVAQASFIRGRPIAGFFVRKAAKEHGTRKIVEGLSEGLSIAGKRALLVEDVTTTGSSVLRAVEAAREAGAEVRTVVTVVDRLEGAEANLAKHDLRLIPLTTARDYDMGP
jgi:orotate phosphoribosyltransferase